MADTDPLAGMQEPRPLSPALRRRLELALTEDDVGGLLQGLDDPLPLAAPARRSLERALGRGRGGRRWVGAVAASAVAAAAAAAGIGVLAHRPAPGPRATALPTPVVATPTTGAWTSSQWGQRSGALTGTSTLDALKDAGAYRSGAGATGPVLRALTPFSGPTGGGTWVTIRGLRLATNTAVLFGGVPAVRLVQVSDDELQALTPPHLAGAADVVVTTPTGRSAPLVFLYLRE